MDGKLIFFGGGAGGEGGDRASGVFRQEKQIISNAIIYYFLVLRGLTQSNVDFSAFLINIKRVNSKIDFPHFFLA